MITTQCIRVPVLDGHTAAVFVTFKDKKPTKEEIIQVLERLQWCSTGTGTAKCTKHFIQYLEDDNRPQVALDVNYENGFGVIIGRLREDAYLTTSLWDFPIIPYVVQQVVLC